MNKRHEEIAAEMKAKYEPLRRLGKTAKAKVREDSLKGFEEWQADRKRKRNRRNGKTVNPSKRYMGDAFPKSPTVQPISAEDFIWMNRGTRY